MGDGSVWTEHTVNGDFDGAWSVYSADVDGDGDLDAFLANAALEAGEAQADDYAKLFSIFIKHKDAIDRVTFWGLSDRRTWRHGQHPLIFDSNNQRKPAYGAIVDAVLHPDAAPTVPR